MVVVSGLVIEAIVDVKVAIPGVEPIVEVGVILEGASGVADGIEVVITGKDVPVCKGVEEGDKATSDVGVGDMEGIAVRVDVGKGGASVGVSVEAYVGVATTVGSILQAVTIIPSKSYPSSPSGKRVRSLIS
jgi:hypothetical protein